MRSVATDQAYPSEHLDRAALAKLIDHTLLRPEATQLDIEQLYREAIEFGVFAACVTPSALAVAKRSAGHEANLAIAAVVGFPSGAHVAEVKAFEAYQALRSGATELDVVINLGAAKDGRWPTVAHEIGLMREVAHNAIVKVIIESAMLTADEIVRACRVAEDAGASFVKTSTGFHPAGGATPAAVRLMRLTVGDRLGVKASGGIRTIDHALAMVRAGATRIGTSSTRAILAGLP
jgi:deoxyribose-phosphate aldolase